MQELRDLAQMVDPQNAKSSLAGLKVIVTHIKIIPLKDPSSLEIIKQQLEKLNDLGIQLIYPEQGGRIEL